MPILANDQISHLDDIEILYLGSVLAALSAARVGFHGLPIEFRLGRMARPLAADLTFHGACCNL